jgi:hypothetical protein
MEIGRGAKCQIVADAISIATASRGGGRYLLQSGTTFRNHAIIVGQKKQSSPSTFGLFAFGWRCYVVGVLAREVGVQRRSSRA